MSNALGRKQRIKNSEWIEALADIEQKVSKKELDQLVSKTVKEIKKKAKGKKAAYAWSGGKDSLVLGEICTFPKKDLHSPSNLGSKITVKGRADLRALSV